MSVAKPYDYHFKILLIGDSAVGKSSILLRFADNCFDARFIATIGVDFKDKIIQIDNETIKLQIWDTAGQERFRTITSTYYRGAAGVVIVYDVTNPKSFVGVTKWLEEAQNNAGMNLALMLVGNKIDLESERIVTSEDGKILADEHGALFLESSAKDNTNVEQVFTEMAKQIRSMKVKQNQQNQGVKLSNATNHKQNKKSKCCK